MYQFRGELAVMVWCGTALGFGKVRSSVAENSMTKLLITQASTWPNVSLQFSTIEVSFAPEVACREELGNEPGAVLQLQTLRISRLPTSLAIGTRNPRRICR